MDRRFFIAWVVLFVARGTENKPRLGQGLRCGPDGGKTGGI